VEPSFLPPVIDHMVRIPDAASLAAMRVLSRMLARRVGGSTGTNFFGLCIAANGMRRKGEGGSIVTLICDSGERYRNTYHAPEWLKSMGLETAAYEEALERFLSGEALRLPDGDFPVADGNDALS